MSESLKNIRPLQLPWSTMDPFLFCMHHQDFYPKGDGNMAPAASLEGRTIGNDFDNTKPWRMYHGSSVPGFPAHPHVGFETVTIARRGWIDHSDSLGAAGRFGQGDVQWMTAGKGVQHCEMFPLLSTGHDNPLELFQIWLNLPRASKKVDPYFRMLWSGDIPRVPIKDDHGNLTEVDVIAGELNGEKAPTSTPDSWAADPGNEVAIMTIRMDANARWQLPLASKEANRRIFFYKGNTLKAGGEEITSNHSADLDAHQNVTLENGDEAAYLLLLQGKPIGEPVVQYGPFVTNTEEEIQQAMSDFRATGFGGWPWPSKEHVHPAGKKRFAQFANGKVVEK